MYHLQMFSIQSNGIMVRNDRHLYRHWQSQEEDIREEEQRTAEPANKGSIGGACQEGSLGLRAVIMWSRALLPAPELLRMGCTKYYEP